MELWQFMLIVGSLLAVLLAFIWCALLLRGLQQQPKQAKSDDPTKAYTAAAERDIEHIFDQQFREELRNRGRLLFEKIISDNAMFLQQDLRLTSSQLNEFMKQEITKTLQDEFAKYETSITDAKQLAIDSIEKTQAAIEQQRQLLSTQLQKEIAEERARHIARFDKNMAEIVNHYILEAIGTQIDLDDQLEYIMSDLEANKKAILEDIEHGA